MNSLMLIKISLRSLAHHKGRTLLTMLGIIIGISTIIATLAIGRGITKKQQDKILYTKLVKFIFFNQKLLRI